VGVDDSQPGEGTESGHQVDEPSKDLRCRRGDVQENQAAKQRTEDQSGVRHTHSVDTLEDGGGLALDGKSVKCPGTNVEVGIGSAHNEDEDSGVDNMVKCLDSDQSCGDDERTGGSSGLLLGRDEQVVGRARDDEADDKDTANVEDQDTEEGPADSDGDVTTGVLSLEMKPVSRWGTVENGVTYLTNGDTDKLGSHIGEESVGQSSPEAEEDGEGFVMNLVEQVFAHGTVRGLPVPKPDTVVLRISTKVDNDPHEEKADESDDYGQS